MRGIIQQVYNYVIQKLLVEVNPALPLRGVIQVPPAEYHRHLTETELSAFWRSVERQGAHFVTIAAAKMLMFSMCRKSEVLRSRWDYGPGLVACVGARLERIRRDFPPLNNGVEAPRLSCVNQSESEKEKSHG